MESIQVFEKYWNSNKSTKNCSESTNRRFLSDKLSESLSGSSVMTVKENLEGTKSSSFSTQIDMTLTS